MKMIKTLVVVSGMALCLVGAAIRGVTMAPPTAEQIANKKIQDLAATVTLRESNRAELKKMGGAFATNYSAKEGKMFYKFPSKLRFETKYLGAAVNMIYNGDTAKFKGPVGINGTRNTFGKAGNKQTLMDFGILAGDYISSDYNPIYVRTEGKLHVFKMMQRNTSNTSHELCWINPDTSIIEKRVSYNGDNILQKTMLYKNPQMIRPGIWVPTRIELYNKDGKMAVAQSMDNIKVNLGVDEELFNVK